MTGINKDWSWKGDEPLTKKAFVKKKKKRGKKKKQCKNFFSSDNFYSSEDWRRLRYRVLRKYSACCMCCGRNKKEHDVVIHIDHIKPRSKHPKLELCFDNLQVLCADCNIGKSNIDDTDWRPGDDKEEKIAAALDEILLSGGSYI